jgi:hypothetical protein
MNLPKLYPPDGGENNQAHPVISACPACPVKSLRVIYPGLNLLFFI